ncbi:heterokaryon incompatibility protein-domain-containing protein [Phaeosphaeriaceae sp. PMI808]|nr:heterokaryon incompatibility protein-domain-containing protein [Phaeosphaeriaceae sp. PMI808]
MATPTTEPILDTLEFRHAPLDRGKDVFRLVKVLPELSEDFLVQCTISQHMIPEISIVEIPQGKTETPMRRRYDQAISQPYICLSYRWGDLHDRKPIKINGNLVYVRKNLENFLAVARITLPDTHLWIDALSIDQSDKLERNVQVQQMGRIYSGARTVLVWLGDDVEVEHILRTVNLESKQYKLYEKLSWHHKISRGNDAFEYEALSTQRAQAVVGPMKSVVDTNTTGAFDPLGDNTGKVEKLFEKLSENEYWSRAWVTQEVLLARHVLVVAGYEVHGLVPLAAKYRAAVVFFKDSPFENLVDILLQKRIRMERMQMMEVATGLEGWGIINLLHRFRNKNCAIRRDRIYSLLALSKESQALRVDYDVPEKQLLRQVLNVRESSICLCSTAIVAHALAPWEFPVTEDGVSEAPFAELYLYTCTLSSAVCPFCSNWVPFSWTRKKGAVFCLGTICPDTPGHLFWEHTDEKKGSSAVDHSLKSTPVSGSIHLQLRRNNKSKLLCEEGAGLSITQSQWKNIYLLRFSFQVLIEVLQEDSETGGLGLNACRNLWPSESDKASPEQARLKLCDAT